MELIAYSPPAQRRPYEDLDPVPDRERRRLLTGARSGDFAAFTELYRFYAARVRAYVQFNVSEAGMAERLADEVFLSAWRMVGCYDPEREPFGVWLYLIARRAVVDFGRARRDVQAVTEILSPADEGLDQYETAEPCAGARGDTKAAS